MDNSEVMPMNIVRVNLILALVLLAFSAQALDERGYSQKLSELELEQEVEEIESFGEAARSEQSKRESESLAKEAKRLQLEITRAKNETRKNESKAAKLNRIYSDKEQFAKKMQSLANKTETERAKTEKRFNQAKARVDAQEKKAIDAIEKRKKNEAEIAKLNKEIKALEARERAAKDVILANEKRYKTLIARQSALRLKQKNMQARVQKLERQADR
jgi:chromosome segregation ATPase